MATKGLCLNTHPIKDKLDFLLDSWAVALFFAWYFNYLTVGLHYSEHFTYEIFLTNNKENPLLLVSLEFHTDSLQFKGFTPKYVCYTNLMILVHPKLNIQRPESQNHLMMKQITPEGLSYWSLFTTCMCCPNLMTLAYPKLKIQRFVGLVTL